MIARTGIRTLVLALLALPLAVGCAQVKASPGGAKASAAADSGWAAIRPDLSASEASGLVSPLKGLGDRPFLEKAYGLILQRDPETAYAYAISRSYGVPEDALTDVSDAHNLGTRELYLGLKAEADRRQPAATGRDALALSALSRWLSDKARDIELSIDKYPISPYVNSVDELTIDYFTEYRQLRDAAEAERYIACLALLPAKIDGIVKALDLRAAAGVVLPRGIYEYTLQGVNEVAEAPALSSPFYTAFASKLAASSVPEGAARTALLDKAARAVERYAIPAWKSLAGALARQAASVPGEGGASRLPDGAAYYAACLSRLTTTSMSATEINDLGKRELSRVQSEIRDGFAALGYPRDLGLAELYDRLGRDGGALAGRDLLARIDADMKAMDARLGDLVLTRPRIGVEAVMGEMGGYYQPPSLDGRPGRYFVAETDRRYAYDIATTAYHETIPGHHLQMARALESDLPGFLRGADFLGFTEGWALYAERLAFEAGRYADDPAGNLGRLRMEALRAARLVADTGVNAMGWSFGQAVDFLSRNTGLGQGMIQADVTRYIIDPGQATAYYTGYAVILGLRERCRNELGGKFDLRRFDEAILANGAIPLDLLGKVVDDFIAAEKAR